ncbi:MAG: hypothetical protein ACRDZR_12785 [Acidimicrobiales bacterium]
MSAEPDDEGRGRNPYRPGASVRPTFLAGRTGELSRFRRLLAKSPEVPANLRIIGLRGVGKSVLLKEQERQADTWYTTRLQIEPRNNSEDGVVDLLVHASEKARSALSRAVRIRKALTGVAATAGRSLTVGFHDIEVSLALSGTSRQGDLAKALFDTAELAYRQGYDGYMVMLDEAQALRDDAGRDGEHPLSLLVAAINTLQEQEVPLALVLCGLPTLQTNLLKARTYSERMFAGESIGRLSDPESWLAFVRPLEGTGVAACHDLVERVIREVEGYPYFVQVWGAELWDAAEDAGVWTLGIPLLEQIEADIYRRLDADFYEGRVLALTPAEADLLMATAACPYPPLRTADIHELSDKSQGNVNVLMGRLVEQGVLYRIQQGQYEYTAPKFHTFLQRRAWRLVDEGRAGARRPAGGR